MYRLVTSVLAILIISTTSVSPVFSQTTAVSFGASTHDPKLPVEIVADTFTLNQNKGTAVFDGNVVVGQGDMRLSAGNILVEYGAADSTDAGKISRMIATGGVTLVNGDEAAEADRAIYRLSEGIIVLEGNVLVTQGQSALSGQEFTINLNDGSARFEGRVKTIFQAEPVE
ncbi:MAG: LptA/OstA family protein [Rhodobacteraceae bacterium]|nr:LptA/OstA family protein [Paracoccaceae bacterium]